MYGQRTYTSSPTAEHRGFGNKIRVLSEKYPICRNYYGGGGNRTRGGIPDESVSARGRV